MAGERRGPAPQMKDTRPLGEKVYDWPKKTNIITMPIGAAGVGIGLATANPLLASASLAGIGGDYMTGEMASEHGKQKTAKRMLTEANGAHASSVLHPEVPKPPKENLLVTFKNQMGFGDKNTQKG